MTEAAKIYSELFKAAAASAEVESVLQKLMGHPAGWALTGAAGAAVPTYMLAKAHAEHQALADKERARNLAFGAGLGTGLVAPSVLKTLGRAAGIGLIPNGTDNQEFTSI